MRRFSLVITAPTGSRIVRLLPEGDVTLGRNPVCDIVLSEEQISRQHAKLSVQNGVLTLEDLGSNNGTFVNGERIARMQTLTGSEVITIGSFQLSITEGEATEGKRLAAQSGSNSRTTPAAINAPMPRTTRPPTGMSTASGPNPTVAAAISQPPVQQTLPQTAPPVSLSSAPPTTTGPMQVASEEELNPWSSEDGTGNMAPPRPSADQFEPEPPFEEEDQTVRLRASQVSAAASQTHPTSIAKGRLQQLEVLDLPETNTKKPRDSAARQAEDARRVEMIARVAEAFTQKPQSAYKELIEVLVTAFSADTAVLLIGENSLEEMKAKFIHHREPLDSGEVPVSRTVIKEVIEQKTPIVTGDVRGDERFEVGASLFLYNLASVMATPLLFQDRFLGILYVNRWTGGAFEEKDLALLNSLAAYVSFSESGGGAPPRAALEEGNFRPALLRQATEKEAESLLAVLRTTEGGSNFSTEDGTALVASLSEVEPYFARLNAQRAGEIISAWRERFTNLVLENGGFLLSIDGLSGKAFFRHGERQPGTAAAIRCALQCRKATFDWFAERMPRLKVKGRFGIHSGRCFVGLCGSKEDPEFTAVGEAIEGALHLEQAAAGGEILASPGSLSLVEGRFELGPVDPARLAGAPEELSRAFAVFGTTR